MNSQDPKALFLDNKATWVIKIGSGVLFDEGLDQNAFKELVETISTIRKSGRKVIVVSSGAVALGRQILGKENSDPSLPHLQALAAVGQATLIQLYQKEFQKKDTTVAQVLFGRDDLHDRRRYLNAEETIGALHRADVLPIINENDTISTEELRFGDNDELAAMTCGLVSADVLVMFSIADGIREVVDGELGDILEELSSDDPLLEGLALPFKSKTGRGGMASKINACKLAARFNTISVIASGKKASVILNLIRRSEGFEGTIVLPKSEVLSGPKVWLSAAAKVSGHIHCDCGAEEAILKRGSSLLPAGVISVENDFRRGDVVALNNTQGKIFAKGIATYDSRDIHKIMGLKSTEIIDVLGFHHSNAVIHRDSLVLID